MAPESSSGLSLMHTTSMISVASGSMTPLGIRNVRLEITPRKVDVSAKDTSNFSDFLIASSKSARGPPLAEVRKSRNDFSLFFKSPTLCIDARRTFAPSRTRLDSKLLPRAKAKTDCPSLGASGFSRRATAPILTLCTADTRFAPHAGFCTHCSKRRRVSRRDPATDFLLFSIFTERNSTAGVCTHK